MQPMQHPLSLAHVRANEVGISNKRGMLTPILAAVSGFVKGTYPKCYLGNPLFHSF
jgi:hypothetical protein